MKISIIAALDKNRLIGSNNQIPWNLPADRKRFKTITLNKPILMGRNTYDSISHPLPDRRNIVVTRDANLKIPGCEVFTSFDTALQAVADAQEIMIIGGVHLYEKFLPIANTMYLTLIDHAFNGDKHFPEWNSKEWRETERSDHVSDDENFYSYSFVTLERI